MWPETQKKVDLELTLLRRLLHDHRKLLDKVRHGEPDGTELLALSALLHSFYTGIENAFKRIAIEIDSFVPTGVRWHSDLLSQMAQRRPDRPAVISSDLCARLGEYMEFRHVFRHAYTFDLNWRKMSDLVLQCDQTLEHLNAELQGFFK